MLVDRARPERLGELVRALLPIAPELEVHTEAQQLVESRPGSTLVLIPRAEDADWLNINRPLFASRALRVVLFCTREVSVALSRGAVDFLDWVSLRLECPAGPLPYAVAGLQRALAARVPGIVWTGGDLEASFAAARPHRVLRKVSATRPYAELVAEARASGPGEWLAWTDVDGYFLLRRVRWALAEARRRTRTLLVEPAVRSPGWWEVHAQIAEPAEASEQLRRAGAKQPGRLAALVDLEPAAIQLLSGLMKRGVSEHSLEEAIQKETDPGLAVGRLASAHGLVTEKQLARGSAPPPAMRAFEAERDKMTLLHQAELEAIEQRLSQGEQVDAEDAGWWSSWARELPPPEWLEYFGPWGEVAEVLLRYLPRTDWLWNPVAPIAISAGDLDVAHVWARHAVAAHSSNWKLLAKVLIEQGQFVEAESLLRQQLTSNEHEPDTTRASAFQALGYVLYKQGRYTDAETFLRQSLAFIEQTVGPLAPNHVTSLDMLAMILERQGRYAEAEELLRRSVAIGKEMLGEQHPDHGRSLLGLAKMLENQGRYIEAENLLRQTLSINEKDLGNGHHRGISLHQLALVLERQGRYAEAEKTLNQALDLLEQALGTQHPDYGASLHQLAVALARKGQYSKAEEHLRRSLAIVGQSFGKQSIDYAASLHELARVLDNQGRYSEAEQLMRQALVIEEQALGPRHPRLCATLANLGFNLTMQGRPQEGEPFLLRSVELARETWGLNNAETAQGLNLLARNQAALKKPEAVMTARQAMDALLHALGEEHPITKNALPGLHRIIAGGE